MTHQRGFWGMYCFNGLSVDQREFLVEEGYLPIGYRPEGPCLNGAVVGIETELDLFPGPRFYCTECAVKYLMEVEDARAI